MAAQGKTHAHPDSLEAKGLIECQEPQGDDVRAAYVWAATAAGRKVAKALAESGVTLHWETAKMKRDRKRTNG